MIRRRRIWVIVLVPVLLWLLGVWLLPPAGTKHGEEAGPVYPPPKVIRLHPREWSEFLKHPRAPAGNWVLLPDVNEHEDYESGIDPVERGFVRAEVCGECHRGIYESCLETAHFRTSSVPTAETILGSFEEGENVLKSRNPDLSFVMEKRDDGFYQTLHYRSEAGEERVSERFGIVIGSGNHGQSYLYWKGNHLFQMHATFLRDPDRWTNSPAFYPDGTGNFARPATSRCLECHATWFAHAPKSVNRYDKENFLLGITCVRCHGPGTEHVRHHREFPEETQGKFIVHPGGLSQERLDDICASCHGGAGEPIRRPSFTYRPGEPLKRYLTLDLTHENPSNDEAHSSNQFPRLMKSGCFQNSEGMTCVTCHDPHRNERDDLKLFAGRCLQCHQKQECGPVGELGVEAEHRCVLCHMPARGDAELLVEGVSGASMVPVRDHYIRVWSEASAAVWEELEEGPGPAVR